MTTTVHHAPPADALAGRINALVCAVLGCSHEQAVPHARLREDLKAGPLDLMRLAVVVECELGLEPVMWSRPEDGFLVVADVLAFAERAAGVPT